MKDLKEKRWYRILKSSKFVETNVEQARSEILALYNKEGYRNARIWETRFTGCRRGWSV